MSFAEILAMGSDLTKTDIISLLEITEESEISLLFSTAKKVKEVNWGSEVNFMGVLKFSNFCEDNCLFCGYREDNFSINRFRMSADEILEAVHHISNLGIKSVILQSGKDSFYDTDLIAYILYSIKNELDISISLALRERGFDEYKAWRLAGADRYILNHEISNSELFSVYHKKKVISSRLNLLSYLNGINYLVGSGTIIGLPNQEMADIADDLLMLQKQNVEMVTISPFLAMPFTPYQNRKNCDRETLLKALAISRILMPKSNIPAVTSFYVLDGSCIEYAINAGANVVQVNFSPSNYKNNFIISNNKSPLLSEEWESFFKIRLRLENSGINITGKRGNLIL